MIRRLLSLAAIGVAVYVAATVPFGERTIWQHIQAIAGTQESKTMVREIKRKAKDVVDTPDPAGRDDGKLTDADRGELRKVIREELEAERRADGGAASVP